ncbi:MAG: hypothetical protein HIU83_08860 [Proteobacteria bacterium]|nr:hypothetical protein [Pseudomonadota bacterium]
MNIGTSLVKSIFSAGAAEIAGDVSELALDDVLNEGVLKDIPVFGWLIKGYRVVSTVKDRIFLKKIAMFLQGATVEIRRKEEFVDKLSDLSFCQKVGENLILLLDRQDNLEKAFILGKSFAAYLSGSIEYDMFLRLAATIDRALITDLTKLPTYYESMKSYEQAPKSSERQIRFQDFLNSEDSQSLCNAGLAFSQNSIGEDICMPTAIGSCLIDLMSEN